MEHIFLLRKFCSSISLAVEIRGLRDDIEYTDFRLKVNDGEWKYLKINNEDITKTQWIHFGFLETGINHTIYGEVKYDTEWHQLKSIVAPTVNNEFKFLLPDKIETETNIGGLLMEDGFPRTPVITPQISRDTQ